MDQLNETNETTENVNNSLVPAAETSSGSVTGDNASAYYGDYSYEIYQYLLQQDYGGHFDDLKTDTTKANGTLTSILAVVIFFVFLFFTFKFIRQKGLDL